MKTRNNPFYNVSSKYGAPMGRRSDDIDTDAPLVAQRARWSCGDYDQGGAYWGRNYSNHAESIYAVYARGRFDDGVAYVRATSAAAAKEKVRE